MRFVKIYTDGGCSPNPGRGGYAAIIVQDSESREIFGGFRYTTNNRMEIFSAIAGLEALREPARVLVFSDSRYLVDAMMKGWVARWRRNGWMRNKSENALNVDLWERLLECCETHQVTFKWIKGHNGHKQNEACDKLVSISRQLPDLPADREYEVMKRELIPQEDMTCQKCGKNPVYVTPKGYAGKLCSECFLEALAGLPNPNCEYCYGTGEYYTHSQDCNNDHCVLAGGYDDCEGVIEECNCSIFDRMEAPGERKN